ncbi:MAG: glycosyltransferase family 2 protein [Candidatus Peregrinibacteria bacterium]|nr:glycosyltransferase family 2 protein [Candidatus Peregrinibacteria bacterium]
MKKNYVSIIIPKYKPKKEIFGKLKKYLKKRVKEFEIIEIEGTGGLANTYNNGIKKAKGDVVITLHQDCIPLEENSIEKLIKPFKDSSVVMAYSWILDDETGQKYFPLPPDGKFVAYRKTALKKIGMFDEKTFFTGGEDVDIWLKLKKIGKITKVKTGIVHIHPGYLANKTLEKRRQNGSINGALFRVWWFKNPKWLKALTMCLRYPSSYGGYFIKAFLSGKQKYRRRE